MSDLRPPDDIRNFVNLPVVKPAISKSLLASMYTCQRKLMYEYLLRLTSTRYAKAPTVGTLFHLAINAHYDGLDTPAVHRLVDAHVDEMTQELLGEPETAGEVDAASRIVRSLAKDAALAKVMAEIYNETFPLDTDQWSIYPAELKLEYTTNSFNVTTRVDRLLYNKELKGLFIQDFKTTSEDPALFQRTLGWSVEADLSRLVVEAAGLNYPVLGFLLGVIQKPGIGIKTRVTGKWIRHYREMMSDKDPQSLLEYLAEVRDWYAGVGFHADKRDARILKPPLRQWQRRYRSQPMTDGLRGHLNTASALMAQDPRLVNFPRTGEPAGVCRSHYNRPCPWLPLCESDPTDWKGIIARDYRVRPASEPDTLTEIQS